MNKTLQLARLFQQAISQGHLRDGDRMPSLRQLCRDHQVSLTTAQRAYAELERQGLIQALPRSGFRVCPVRPPARHCSSTNRLWRMEQFTTDYPMPWGCPFMNPALINTTRMNQALSRVLHDYRGALASNDINGFEGLRRELALHYLSQGIALENQELLITCGGMEALSLCIRAVVSTSGRNSLLVVTPAFPAVLDQLRQQGIQILETRARPDGSLDMKQVETLLQQQPAGMVLMSSFQHPTGLVLPEQQKQALIDLAEQYRTFLIEDDTYRELFFGQQSPLPLKAYDRSGLVLHCSSFSKSLAPGYRVGWAAAGRLADTVRGLKLCSSLGTPLPGQMALARLLASGHHVGMLSRLRSTLRQRCLAMQQALQRHFPEGTALTQPLGGYFQWLTLPAGHDADALLPRATEQGMHFAPSSLFYPNNGPCHAMRLNFSFYEPLEHASGISLLATLLTHVRQP